MAECDDIKSLVTMIEEGCARCHNNPIENPGRIFCNMNHYDDIKKITSGFKVKYINY